MREMIRSALVARPPAMLYQLVEDVERYPEFVPGCTSAQVLERGEHEMVARLAVRRGPLRTAFTTRNRSIRAAAFTCSWWRARSACWRGMELHADRRQGCRIEFSLRFQFSNALKSALFDALFEETAASLVRAFVARAQSSCRPPNGSIAASPAIRLPAC